MHEDIVYRYPSPSGLQPVSGGGTLRLEQCNEQDKVPDCLFFGSLRQPYLTARCLTALSRIVQSRFTLSPETIQAMHDPIISAGNGTIRFEGFSGCAGIYARVDLLPEALNGVFYASGTTNVDFHTPMLDALGGVRRQDAMQLSVGHNEVVAGFTDTTVIERKVPLPERWLKGLTSVQTYLSGADHLGDLDRVQAVKLLQSVPRGKARADMYLIARGRGLAFSPAAAAAGVPIGGVNRLLLLESLLPFVSRVRVFAHPSHSATIWQADLGAMRFTFSLSREPYRGFSGEGAGLDALLDGLPAWLPASLPDFMSAVCAANEPFNPHALVEALLEQEASGAGATPASGWSGSLGACLAAMGLLGYDLESGYFYRKLPYKTRRILALNPRLKNALKLVDSGKVDVQLREDGSAEGRVFGSGVWHSVVLDNLERGGSRCTCAWFGTYGLSRGPCKHILAVKQSLRGADIAARPDPDTPVQ